MMPIPTTDPGLLLALRDEITRTVAWPDFQKRYEPVIRHWCIKRGWRLENGLQSADVDDLTQTVLVKLFSSLPGYEHDPAKGKFRSYLATIVRTSVCDFLRAGERRFEEFAIGGTAFQEILAELQSPEASLDLATSIGTEASLDPILTCVVQRVRDKVKPTTWRAFELYVGYGLDVGLIAAELQMKKGAVYRAADRVRDMLNREFLHLTDPKHTSSESNP